MLVLFLKIAAWTVLLAVLVFWPAGTLFYPGGILFMVLFGLTGFLFTAWLHKTNPALLRERMGSPLQRDQKPWDRVFLLTFMIAFMAWIVFMSWDAARTHFSAMPAWLTVLGVGLFALYGIGCWWTFRENAFAAPVVKIQHGQKVIDTGPYALVRHPMYTSSLPFFLSMPLLFGSWWGGAFSLFFILGIAWHAVREEETLRVELPGYADYMQRVRYRLMPLVW